MPLIALKAHYDGERIILDEPFDLPPNSPLVVTVLQRPDVERAEWEMLGAESLSRAYGSDEPEYTAADIKQDS